MFTDNVKKVETYNALLQRKIKEKEAETETLKAEVKKVEMEKEKMKIKASLGEPIGMAVGGTVGALAFIPVGPTGFAAGLSAGVKVGGTVGELVAKIELKRPGKLNLYYSMH